LGNFGIGLIDPDDSENVIEDNTIDGNANGILMLAGAHANVIRRNLVVGNPSVQVAVDHNPSSGADVQNLAAPGANTFVGNVCLTGVNAPCPSIGPSLTANPNPIPVTGNAIVGSTTISWNAPGAQVIEVHLSSPNGKLFTQGGSRGSMQTGIWVPDGMTFYLQDVTGGNPLTSDYTLSTLVVHLQAGGTAHVHLPGGPYQWAFGAWAVLVTLTGIVIMQAVSRRKRVRTALGGAVLLASVGFSVSHTTVLAQQYQTASSSQASPQQTAGTLDRMIASGKGPRELAQYIFDTKGCKNCHTIGQDGKLGFTDLGKDRARVYEGCISVLTAMTVITKVPKDQRSPTQRRRAERFEEFGCTTCHKPANGKMALTEVGTKLGDLHLGYIDIEKLVSNRTAARN
jgi:parallel beta-helix repeat protein